MFYKQKIKEIEHAIDDLEEKSKNKWESTTKRVETCEKANEMIIKAFNEQREIIAKIVNVLRNIQKTDNTKNSKKGAK